MSIWGYLVRSVVSKIDGRKVEVVVRKANQEKADPVLRSHCGDEEWR